MKSVVIRSYSVPHFPAFGLNTERYRISPYSVRMRENTEQNNSEYGHFLHSETFNKIPLVISVNNNKTPNNLEAFILFRLMSSFSLTIPIKTIIDEFADHFYMKVLRKCSLMNSCPFCIIHFVHALCFIVYQHYNFFTKVKGNLQQGRSYLIFL